MNAQYTLIVSIKVLHTYFASGMCEDLIYKPSDNTQTMLNTYGFAIRKTISGFELYANTQQPIANYLNYIEHVSGTDSFQFIGTATNQTVYQYTDEIPLDTIGILSYEVEDASKTPMLLKKTFIPSSEASFMLQITISFKALIEALKLYPKPTCQIQLNTRKTQWLYNIINNSSQSYTNITIQSNTPEIEFLNKGKVTLQNGQKATVFASQTQIPLKNTAQYKFDIVNNKQTIAGNRNEIIFKGLPVANAKNLIITDQNSIASPIYVYI